MRLLVLIACVVGSLATASARERLKLRAPSLAVVVAAPSSPPRLALAAAPLLGERSSALVEDLARAEDTLAHAAAQVQHLGSAWRSRLWFSPMLDGGRYGITLRLDLP